MKIAIAAAALALGVVLGLLAWTWVVQPPRIASAPEPPVSAPEEVPAATRDVTPPNMIPGPRIDGPLTRIDVPDPPPPPPRWRRFFLPVVEEAGLLRLGKRTVRIADIAPLAADTICPAAAGEVEWNCGRAALTALQRLVRGRAVECLVAGDEGDAITAPCRVGSFDLALWLATTGWGKPSAGAAMPIVRAAAAARCARRGLWRDADVPADCAGPESTGATAPAP